MKKPIIIAMIALVLAARGQAQTDTAFQMIKVISGDIVAFAVDNLDHIYLLSAANQLKKLNPAGDSMAVYNDVKKFGKATLIDVSNPLKVLLYYRDFATIVVLDRLLNVRNTIDLRKQHILQVRAIGQSYDNKIWLYDEFENKLKKIDEEGKVLSETPDFRLLLGEAPAPQQIVDEDRYVYLYDREKGIFVFDYYGTLKSKIPVEGWQNIKVAGKYIFGSAGNKLFRYTIATFQMKEWKMPEAVSQSVSFAFSSSRFYVLKKDRLEIYSLR